MTIGFPVIADALSLQSLLIAQSPTALSVQPGPSTSVRYCMVDGYGLYRWYLNDTTTANGTTVVSASGGSVGRWKLIASLPSAVEGLTADIVVTSNVASLSGSITHDGITPPNGADILLSAQSAGTENGLWTINTSGAWTRSTRWDTSTDTRLATIVRIVRGTANGGSTWLLTSPITGTITPGTTSQTWTKIANEVADKTKLDAATSSATASTLVMRDGSSGTELSSIAQVAAITGVDATASGNPGSNTVWKSGRPLAAEIGTRNWGHYATFHGLPASANAYQSGMIVHQVGDDRNATNRPEGVWSGSDNGFVGFAGYDPDAGGVERTPYYERWQTGQNPTTLKGVGILLSAPFSFVQAEGYSYTQLSGIGRGAYHGFAWSKFNSSATNAGDGQGGNLYVRNHRCTTVGTTSERLLTISNFTVNNILAVVDVWVICHTQGGTREHYHFWFNWLGGAGVLVGPNTYTTSAGTFNATAGRVAVSNSGLQLRIDVTGLIGETMVWTLVGFDVREVL